VLKTIGEFPDVPPGFVKHAVQEEWRRLHKAKEYEKKEKDIKDKRLQAGRRKERKKNVHQSTPHSAQNATSSSNVNITHR
jgi:hypothetical protein